MDQALSLPEIREYICLFLSRRDRKSCALVSRAWSESMTLWLWSSVVLHKANHPEKLIAIHKYNIFVRALRFEGPIDIFGLFANLQTLHFEHFAYQSDISRKTADLIRRNQSSLQRIHVNCYDDENSVLFRASLECPSLKNLHYDCITNKNRDLMESFLLACTRLTTLSLERTNFDEGTHLMFHGQTFAGLEQVRLQYIRGPYLDFLRACPNLKALTIFQVGYVSAKAFLEVVTTHCKQLVVLSCSNCGFDSDYEFEELVLALPPMKCLQNKAVLGYDPNLYLAYFRHFKTLQAIHVPNLYQGDGKDIQTILSFCPNLRSFVGNFVNAKDIVAGPPWVCQRLEYLQVEILVCHDDRRLDLAICDQLSQLKELHTLNLSMGSSHCRKRSQKRSLSLRLGEGLELLASLSNLEHFGVGCLRPEWRAGWRSEDIEWMAQAWPNLEAIYGEYREEDEIYSRMCKQMGVSRVRKELPRLDFIDFIDL